jgi:serine/threonine protein kinase
MVLPSRIGRYDVVRLLGQGGMGRVLLAHDSVLGRRVALKLLRDDLGLPPEPRQALFERMRQEARAAAALEHPNMVTLHDMGEEDPYGLYLVFEFVEGPTLREELGETGLALHEVPRLARELGDALTAAHEAGVIHRDVKPENVMLSRHGAKLTDFGIARLPDSTLTRAGSILGTPAYSAPEALALAEFSAASDQFSLAATLYETICGARAFPGDDALAIAARIATEPAPMLPPGAVDARVASRIDLVLGRAMARDPARRFASCRELGDALAKAIEARIIDSSRVSELPPRSIVPRQTRRIQNFIAAGALIVIVALLLLGRRSSDAGVSLRRVSNAFAAAIAKAPERERAAVVMPPPPPRARPATGHGDAGTDAEAHADASTLDARAATAPAVDAEPRDASGADAP